MKKLAVLGILIITLLISSIIVYKIANKRKDKVKLVSKTKSTFLTKEEILNVEKRPGVQRPGVLVNNNTWLQNNQPQQTIQQVEKINNLNKQQQ